MGSATIVEDQRMTQHKEHTKGVGNLYEAAHLIAKGFRLIDHYGTTRTAFVFEPEVEGELSAFRSGTAMVNALAFAEAVRQVKQIVFKGRPR
jgi:hypothetical protein